MASTKELADTLPLYPPDPTGGNAHDSQHSSWAAYSLVPLKEGDQERLLDDLNTGDWSAGQCILATQPDFSGRTLRDIYDHHIEASKEDNEMHPHFIIVADQDDWDTNGVLLVYLYASRVLTPPDDDDYDDEFVVGVLRCGVEMADTICCNLEIANMGWEEFKGEEERDWGGEGHETNPRYSKYNLKTGELN
ncbi:hypothetical protein E4T48_00863 [Aureobasidium sp. EXF-10727]|nr:hypothetical protein E4T48_00863 [Aureobasidium sp. EXF-10727]KAI4730729.1 hypothetical protein E4T49_01554 [Aureobasidium sp. EXF-10728]